MRARQFGGTESEEMIRRQTDGLYEYLIKYERRPLPFVSGMTRGKRTLLEVGDFKGFENLIFVGVKGRNGEK